MEYRVLFSVRVGKCEEGCLLLPWRLWSLPVLPASCGFPAGPLPSSAPAGRPRVERDCLLSLCLQICASVCELEFSGGWATSHAFASVSACCSGARSPAGLCTWCRDLGSFVWAQCAAAPLQVGIRLPAAPVMSELTVAGLAPHASRALLLTPQGPCSWRFWMNVNADSSPVSFFLCRRVTCRLWGGRIQRG